MDRNSEIDDIIQSLYRRADWRLIPPHMWDGVKLWIECGIPMGDFGHLMMQHDIYRAALHADMANSKSLHEWIQFMHRCMPNGCHGSLEKVEAWRAMRGLRGNLMESAQNEQG